MCNPLQRFYGCGDMPMENPDKLRLIHCLRRKVQHSTTTTRNVKTRALCEPKPKGAAPSTQERITVTDCARSNCWPPAPLTFRFERLVALKACDGAPDNSSAPLSFWYYRILLTHQLICGTMNHVRAAATLCSPAATSRFDPSASKSFSSATYRQTPVTPLSPVDTNRTGRGGGVIVNQYAWHPVEVGAGRRPSPNVGAPTVPLPISIFCFRFFRIDQPEGWPLQEGRRVFYF